MTAEIIEFKPRQKQRVHPRTFYNAKDYETIQLALLADEDISKYLFDKSLTYLISQGLIPPEILSGKLGDLHNFVLDRLTELFVEEQ